MWVNTQVSALANPGRNHLEKWQTQLFSWLPTRRGKWDTYWSLSCLCWDINDPLPPQVRPMLSLALCDKRHSPSEWTFRLFKLSTIVQLWATQFASMYTILPLDYDWWILERGDCFYAFISAHLLSKPSLKKWLGPWHSLYSMERETIFSIGMAPIHITL